jgi:hypothetical protein
VLDGRVERAPRPEYADRLYVLERGEILYAGKPGDTFPPEVQRVIGSSA